MILMFRSQGLILHPVNLNYPDSTVVIMGNCTARCDLKINAKNIIIMKSLKCSAKIHLVAENIFCEKNSLKIKEKENLYMYAEQGIYFEFNQEAMQKVNELDIFCKTLSDENVTVPRTSLWADLTEATLHLRPAFPS